MRYEAKTYINLNSKWGCPNIYALKSISSILRWSPLLLRSTPMLYYYINSIFFNPATFLIKIYNIWKNNILTFSCWASVESWLLWRYASRSSLLYSGFRYTIELPLQPYKMQLFTFRVQGLAFFLPWFPDYQSICPLLKLIFVTFLPNCKKQINCPLMISDSSTNHTQKRVHNWKLFFLFLT